MPLYKDDDKDDTFTEVANFDGAEQLVTWTTDGKGETFKLDINPISITFTGVYNIEFIITDSDSEGSGTKESIKGGFKLTVNNSTFYDPDAEEKIIEEIDFFTLSESLVVQEGLIPPEPIISKISSDAII